MATENLMDYIVRRYGSVLDALSENYFPLTAPDPVQEAWDELDQAYQELMTRIGYFEDLVAEQDAAVVPDDDGFRGFE